MSKETRIELTAEVTNQLLDMKHKGKYMEELPFEEFTLLVPISVYLSKDKIISDMQYKTLDPIKDNKAFKFINQYASSNLSIGVLVKENLVRFEVKDMFNHILFRFTLPRFFPMPVVEKNEFSKTPIVTAMSIAKLVDNTLDYITSPAVEIRTRHITEQKPSKNKKKKGSSSKKTYIYKTIYSVDKIASNYVPRTYTRKTESWEVRGFWRKYRNPDGTIRKKVWIDKQIRGKGKVKPKELRITRIDGR
jgi:hypothetical protein